MSFYSQIVFLLFYFTYRVRNEVWFIGMPADIRNARLRACFNTRDFCSRQYIVNWKKKSQKKNQMKANENDQFSKISSHSQSKPETGSCQRMNFISFQKPMCDKLNSTKFNWQKFGRNGRNSHFFLHSWAPPILLFLCISRKLLSFFYFTI